jgi:hypothetical protein
MRYECVVCLGETSSFVVTQLLSSESLRVVLSLAGPVVLLIVPSFLHWLIIGVMDTFDTMCVPSSRSPNIFFVLLFSQSYSSSVYSSIQWKSLRHTRVCPHSCLFAMIETDETMWFDYNLRRLPSWRVSSAFFHRPVCSFHDSIIVITVFVSTPTELSPGTFILTSFRTNFEQIISISSDLVVSGQNVSIYEVGASTLPTRVKSDAVSSLFSIITHTISEVRHQTSIANGRQGCII